MPKAFITGATGFVGSHLVDALIDKGFELWCLKRKSSNTRWLIGKNVNYVEGDLFANDVLESVISEMDYIFHIAGVVKAKSAEGFVRGNHLATKNLIEITCKVKPDIKKFVHISSQAVCGPNPNSAPINEDYSPKPITNYGKTKLLAETEVLKYKDMINVSIVRPPAVYGPRDTEIFIYFKTYASGLNSVIGFDDKYLSIIYVKDLVDGIILASEPKINSGEIFFICSDRSYNWDEIGEITGHLMNKKAFKLRIPHFLVYTSGAISQFLSLFSKNPATLNIEKCKDITQKRWTCSNDKAKKMLGFNENFPLEKGFEETINWYRNQGWLK